MKKEIFSPYQMNSISELHRILEIPRPGHPLISVIDFSEIKCYSTPELRSVNYNFYSIALKRGFKGELKYGQNYYDFDQGIMTFMSPGQILSAEIDPGQQLSGLWLLIHPDFLRGSTLAQTIREYGYFSYAVNEALHLSEREEQTITGLMDNIRQEYASIDGFSQKVILSQVELLLSYCDRFYNRQFITRRHVNNDILTKVEHILNTYFSDEKCIENGLPTVQYMAQQTNISAHYLSDMLKAHTGQNTQQHIHNFIIEKAKTKLSGTKQSVSEIAYQLGFEYPQSFNKLFKNKTGQSPLAYRHSFN